MRAMILTMVMFTMTVFGGVIATGVSADTPVDEEVAVEEEVVTDESESTKPYLEGEEQFYNDVYNHDNVDLVYDPALVEQDEEVDTSPKGIIESQTGLVVDYIKTIDSYGDWGAYYCHCDGDLYCITIDEGVVDVCVILN